MAQRKKIDVASVLGLITAFAGVLGGQVLEGGHLGSLAQLTAFLIVFFGTIGAVMLQSPMHIFLLAIRMAPSAFYTPVLNPESVKNQAVEWAHIGRKEGILMLERIFPSIQDPFALAGLQMLVDGFEPEEIHDALDVRLSAYDETKRNAARVWEAAGGYAPTVGILGAVLGLIHVMENLADPSKLGPGIAVAFVATIYGVAFANLVFLPLSNKLKTIVREEVMLMEMIQDGIVSIAKGENPRLIGARLQSYYKGDESGKKT